MKAKEMKRGSWYRLVPNTHGRFTYDGPTKDGKMMCCLDGDQDMQSMMILEPEREVERAEPKY